MRIEQSFVTDIKDIVESSRHKAYAAINSHMVEAYWKIGERIVMEEQKGERRAQYGAFLIKELSKKLGKDLGRGFDVANLKNFRQFYLAFSEEAKSQKTLTPPHKAGNQRNEKSYAVRSLSESISSWVLRKELSWTHYRLIMRVYDPKAREYYMNEAADNNWSTRVLERNIDTHYYERILSTANKQVVIAEAELSEKQSTADFIKDPYIFEFLKKPEHHSSNEQELESALIENLQQFLLELGKGFCFVKRQFRINIESSSLYIDLVFYNLLLKCYVLFELKTGALTPGDIGQMDMYVRMFDDLERGDSDNPTIGVILCTDKDETIVKYSILNGSEQLFATKYRSCLPSEQELIAEIDRNKFILQEKLKTSELN